MWVLLSLTPPHTWLQFLLAKSLYLSTISYQAVGSPIYVMHQTPRYIFSIQYICFIIIIMIINQQHQCYYFLHSHIWHIWWVCLIVSVDTHQFEQIPLRIKCLCTNPYRFDTLQFWWINISNFDTNVPINITWAIGIQGVTYFFLVINSECNCKFHLYDILQ